MMERSRGVEIPPPPGLYGEEEDYCPFSAMSEYERGQAVRAGVSSAAAPRRGGRMFMNMGMPAAAMGGGVGGTFGGEDVARLHSLHTGGIGFSAAGTPASAAPAQACPQPGAAVALRFVSGGVLAPQDVSASFTFNDDKRSRWS